MALATNSTSGCKRILYAVRRATNGSHLVGTVVNQHARVTAGGPYNLTAYFGGYLNSQLVGTMLQQGQDNCQTSGPHTMQWYVQGPYGTSLWRNTTLPDENTCVLCFWPYYAWQNYEYTWSFWS
jgi:hypothetical protein